jgi:hypothetical protein
MKYLIPLLLIFTVSCNTQKNVEYRDHTHLVFLGGLVMGHALKTGMTPENIVDAQGKPLLSWRVVILQYGTDGDLALYKQFKFDEPWDSEHNMKVAEQIPEYYMDPEGSKYTPYLGVTGKTAAFSDRPRPIDGTRDSSNSIHGVGKTHAAIVTVDTNKVKVYWTEPKDVPLEKIEENLRWYKNQTLYMDTIGGISPWEKDKEPPMFEFE